jgi:hypothetical protein
MYNPADFTIQTVLTNDPLENVVARVYSADGRTFYTQGITDSNGHVGFLLDDSVQYQLRLYKFQVSFTNPYLFAPVGDINEFNIKGIVLPLPSATDARLCRASGYFRRGNGSPARNVDIHFIPKFDPLILEGSAVLTERDITRTDDKGYMQIDLIRCGQYDVRIQGMEDIYRSVAVPDAPSVNLPDLLFPVVNQITFNPTGPFIVTIGTDVDTTPTIIASDGQVLTGTGAGAVIWGTEDPTIAAVLDDGTKLTLRAFKAGITNLTAQRFDRSIIRYPDLPIVGMPVMVTVP